MNLIDKLKGLILTAGALMALPSCEGMFAGIYDNTADETPATVAGRLYVDASDWEKWYYFDLTAASDSTAPEPFVADIQLEATEDDGSGNGICTYWFDVFGAGLSVNEFRDFTPTAAVSEPEKWTFAVHRNNVRTNGCAVAVTAFGSFDEIPDDPAFMTALVFEEDEMTENEVWCIQDRMLLGLIGCQRLPVSKGLSSWLKIDIPPMPPMFTHDSRVRIIRLPDGTCGALQLEDYMSPEGTKCCLTINYRYPI